MLKNILYFLKKDLIFTISFFISVICCYVGRFSLTFIDLKVVIILFSLMLIVESLKEENVLEGVSEIVTSRSKTKRNYIQLLICLSFISSMLFTNDVSVLTLLPTFLLISKKKFSKKETVQGSVMIILAANLGSSIFPIGNPQNIFIFSYYHLSMATFLFWMFPFFVLSVVSLLVLSWLIPKEDLIKSGKLNSQKKVRVDIRIVIAFIMMMGYITNILSSELFVVIAVSLILFKSLNPLKNIDYKLLFTFIFFFLIVGNLSENKFINEIIIKNNHSNLWSSAIISQLISNVPSAILMAPFTNNSHSIIIGTNIGGMGTLVASLANLIGYKIFKNYEINQKNNFLKFFSIVNFGLLVLFLFIFSYLV